MKALFSFALVLLAVCGFMPKAQAATDDNSQNNKVTVGGALYTPFSGLYKYNLTSGGGGTNGFDLDQADLFVNYQFNSQWGAAFQTGIIRSGTTFNTENLYIRQANIIGKNLWGDGSKLLLGQILNPHFMYFDVPLNLWWLTFSTPMQYFMISDFDTGAAASGKLGPVDYSLFVESGKDTAFQPGMTNNSMAYQGLARYSPIDGLSFIAEDTFTSGPSGAGARGPDNYFEASAMWKSDWVDAAFELSHFSHGQSNLVNVFPENLSVKGPVSATAFNLIANVKLPEGWSVFGNFTWGDSDFQNDFLSPIGVLPGFKSNLLVGPTYSWDEGKLGLGLMYDDMPPSDAALAANPHAAASQGILLKAKAIFL